MIRGLRELIRRKFTVFTMSLGSYQRYRFVSELLVKEGCNTILDVGGGSGRFFKRFLPNKQSLTFDKEEGDIIGDGTNLPFPKNHFDAVTCLETLQYVKKKDRKKFVKELIRVSKKCVVISLPLDSPQLRSFEKECNDLHNSLFGKGNRWLDEHVKNVLPTKKDMKVLTNGYSVEIYSTGNLKRWKRMLKLSFVLQKARLLIPLSIINYIYLKLYGLDSEEPTYTKIFLVKDVNR